MWSTDGGTETCDDANANNNDDCPDDAANGGACLVASCSDGFLHDMGTGDETNTDCGGATCFACPDGLLLSELVVTPTDGEYIEITNPTAEDVSLGRVYLADYNTYYGITQGTDPPGASDFRVKFPGAAMIGAGATIVVSTQPDGDFELVYTNAPDYDFADMQGEMGASETRLSNADEMVVAFFWDGTSDDVQDIDYLLWGDASDAMDKSGVTVGAHTYLAETAAASQDFATAPSTSGDSLVRCPLSEGAEVQTGSNGFNGADETSEDMSVNWFVSTPTPGVLISCTQWACAPYSDQLDEFFVSDFSFVSTISITSSQGTVTGCNGLSRDPVTGDIYAMLKVGAPGRVLHTLDPLTGIATPIGDTGDNVANIAWDATGSTLYGVTGDGAATSEGLFTVDPTTGVLTQVAALGAGSDGESIAFNPNDGLVYHFSGRDTNGAFESLDPNNGFALTSIGFIGTVPDEVFSSRWDAGANAFVITNLDQEVWTVATDGTSTNLGLSTSNGTTGQAGYYKGVVIRTE